MMDNHHGTQKMRLGLAVKLLFNMGVAYKNEGYNFKVVVLDGRRETLDKLGSQLLPGLQDSSQHFTEIIWPFLELLGMVCNEVLS